MIAVLEANNSKLDAVRTTASLIPRPPTNMPSSEMKRSLSAAFSCSGSKPIDSAVKIGEVMTMVMMTATMARRVVRRSGNRMAGLSWLMLSNPENASQAEAKPTSRS